MDYDAVIRAAAKAICKARYGHLRGFEGRERAYEKEARAAAPILMEYGARLMRDAAATHVCGLIARHAKDGCVGATADSIGGIIGALDPRVIVRSENNA